MRQPQTLKFYIKVKSALFFLSPRDPWWEQQWRKGIKNRKREKQVKKTLACYPELRERKDKVYFGLDIMGRKLCKSLLHAMWPSQQSSAGNNRTPCSQTSPSVPSLWGPQLQKWGWGDVNFSKRLCKDIKVRQQQWSSDKESPILLQGLQGTAKQPLRLVTKLLDGEAIFTPQTNQFLDKYTS